MNLYGALDRRLRSEDLTQALSLILLFLSLTLVFSWTGNPLAVNDSWFNVGAVRRASLGVLALYLALRASSQPPVDQFAGYLALLCVAVVTVPFELVTFAASYPAASLGLSTAFDLVFPLGLYGIALAGTRVVPRAPWLTLLFTLLVLLLFVAADELLQTRLLSPLAIITADDWLRLAVWSLLALAGPVVMLTAGKPEES